MRTVSLVLAVAATLVSTGAAADSTALPPVKRVVDHVNDLYRADSSAARLTMKVVTARYRRELALQSWTRGKKDALVVVNGPAREAGMATLEGGPASLQEICSRTGIPVHAGRRLLVALTAMRLIRKDGDRYLLAPASRELLLRSSPEWLGWLARHVDRFLYPLWSRVAEAVRQDGHQRQAVLGDPRSWFEILYQDPRDVQDFQAFLAIMARPFIDGLVRSFDFSPFRSFMDIGSGSGELPLAVAARHEKLELAVCELPEAARAMRERMRTARHGERVQVLEGDVIAGDIPRGRHDLIHLGWMLHDYAPATQARILRNIHDALPPGGTFIASETPLDDDEAGPLFTSLLSLNMLVSTDGGGEATRREYVARFQEAGFENVRVVSIPGPRTLFLGARRRADRVEGA